MWKAVQDLDLSEKRKKRWKNVYHLKSRWPNSHLLVYHVTFWELRHLLSPECVPFFGQPTQKWIEVGCLFGAFTQKNMNRMINFAATRLSEWQEIGLSISQPAMFSNGCVTLEPYTKSFAWMWKSDCCFCWQPCILFPLSLKKHLGKWWNT